MGWIANKIAGWAVGTQRKEMLAFIEQLRSMDGAELGGIVALAHHVRSKLEAQGHQISDPLVYVAMNPQFPLMLSGLVRQLQKLGKLQEAAGAMVWAHTVRAAVRQELRGLAREMWSELERGFPHVEDAGNAIWELAGVHIDVRGADQFPIGFTPQPLR